MIYSQLWAKCSLYWLKAIPIEEEEGNNFLHPSSYPTMWDIIQIHWTLKMEYINVWENKPASPAFSRCSMGQIHDV
jgi:hypothetical protein